MLLLIATQALGADVGLPGWVPTLGPAGLLAVAVMLILTGRLVPVRQLNEARADRDAWRETSEKKDVIIRDLMDGSRTTLRVIRAVEEASGEARRD